MEHLILWAALKHPWIATALLVIGILRTINKPALALLWRFVRFTPWRGDDILLERVERSKSYRIALFLLDWLASIKLPKTR